MAISDFRLDARAAAWPRDANGRLTQYGMAYPEGEPHYVHEDYRHSPFAIEGYVEKGLVWEGELDPFANMVAQGLPGPDGKIGTSDDTAALTSQVYSSMKSRMQYGNYFTSMGRNNWRGQYGEMGSGMGDSLLDIGGPSSYAPNGGPDTLLSIGGSGNAHGGSPWSQGLGGAGSFSGGPMTGNAGGGSGWSQNLGGASGLTNPGSGNPFSQLGGGGLPYSGLFNAGGVNQSPLQTNGALIAGAQGLASDDESDSQDSQGSFFGFSLNDPSSGDASGTSTGPSQPDSGGLNLTIDPTTSSGAPVWAGPLPTDSDGSGSPGTSPGWGAGGYVSLRNSGEGILGRSWSATVGYGYPPTGSGGKNEPGDDSSGYPEDPASLHFFPRLDLMPSDSTSGGGAVDPGWIVGRVCEPSDDSIPGGGGADLSANHSYGGGDP